MSSEIRARDLLGRQIDDPEVRALLGSLGEVEESVEAEEQGPEHYAAVRSAGIEVMSVEGVIQVVVLYREGHQSYGGYARPLPLGLDFSYTREDVRRLLGAPSSKERKRTTRISVGSDRAIVASDTVSARRSITKRRVDSSYPST